MTVNFKKGFHVHQWRPMNIALNAHAAGGSLEGCFLKGEHKRPFLYQLASATVLNLYDWVHDGPNSIISPALAGTFGAGTAIKQNPTHGPSGILAAGCTTSQLVLSTALPAAVPQGSLVDRADDTGFRIRIMGNTVGGSGKTEVRRVIANTAGTTPTLTLDAPLSFTPAAGSTYEFMSGRLYMLNAGTQAAGTFKYFDILTRSMSGNLAFANLPATVGTDSNLIALCEEYVPWNVADDQLGFLGALKTATAIAASTLTGADETVLTNEYRNFAVKIVEDVVNPTAVGQRRRISSHTSGPNPIYTLYSAWTVNPSTSAKYVIVNDHDKLILRTSAMSTTYCYNVTADTWDTTTFAASGSACAAGVCMEQAFSIVPDAQRLARHSHFYQIRGGTNAIDLFNIAGAATGAWTNDIGYRGKSALTSFGAGTCMIQDPISSRLYINRSGLSNHFFALDMVDRVMYPIASLKYPQGTAAVGNRMAPVLYESGADKIPGIILLRSSGSEIFRLDLLGESQ